jgi:hypothetical protein
MKIYKRNLIIFCTSFIVLTGLDSCKKSFLDPKPYGRYTEEQLNSKKGVEGVLTGAYAFLDGNGLGSGWMVGAANWVYGDVASDDCYKGTDANDQPQMTEIELYNSQPANTYFNFKWQSLYEGVSRSNAVIKLVPKVAELTDADKKDYLGQARFLRAHFHFEAKRMWNKVPYISDTTTTYNNNSNIWPLIEADFKFAYDNLPETQPQAGKANKWAAASYLAKAYMYDKKFAEAKALYDVIITSGKTANGKAYDLQPEYWKNWDPNSENSAESVFAEQYEAAGTVDQASAREFELAFPYGGDFGCCGFMQPSQNLVNAHKLDASGLPFLDESYNTTDLKSDEGVLANDPYTNDNATAVDSRLDWSVGRRGISYWDWGPHPGRSWIRDQAYAGPFSPKKHVYSKADIGVATSSTSNHRLTAKNYNIIRFADVLLLAAEAEIEVGSLAKAQQYINRVRTRAMNNGSLVKAADGSNAANYQVKLYTVPFIDQDYARKAVRFERRIELALEGHRFFDLVRWGIADQVLNTYLAKEKLKRSYMNTAAFTKGKNEYYPIADPVIQLAKKNGNTLEQNPGY